MQNPSHKVRSSETGKPLVAFLAMRLDISKKKAKQLLDERRVFVNTRRVWMAQHALHDGDVVEIQGSVSPPASAKIRKLFEDDSYVVVEKPAGVLSVGPSSLETQLAPLVAVHRLDRDTSGCMIFARSMKAKEALLKLFDAHGISKVYHAVVIGAVPSDLREVSLPIDGKTAVTRIMLLSSNRTASHLKLNIATGRTHQIRKHMAAVGYPVAGDKTYSTGSFDQPALRRVTRQMIHAAGISFTHPGTGQAVRVKSPLPPDFAAFLRAVGLT